MTHYDDAPANLGRFLSHKRTYTNLYRHTRKLDVCWHSSSTNFVRARTIPACQHSFKNDGTWSTYRFCHASRVVVCFEYIAYMCTIACKPRVRVCTAQCNEDHQRENSPRLFDDGQVERDIPRDTPPTATLQRVDDRRNVKKIIQSRLHLHVNTCKKNVRKIVSYKMKFYL